MSSEPGYGIWITKQKRWCRAIDGMCECAMVIRDKKEAQREARRQSRLYRLGQCLARPFDWSKERPARGEKD